MTTYTINPKELEAVSLAASTEQTRYYLNGVLIERYEDETTALVATDGHRMASLRAKLTEQPVESLILANADIKRILTLYKGEVKTLAKSVRHFLKIVIGKNDDDKLELSLNLCDDDGIGAIRVSFTTKPIDGTFPNYRRIIPSKESDGAYHISFNCKYMNDFGKMSSLLVGNKCEQIAIQNTGISNPMIITIPQCADFLGVLMPMRA